LLRRLLEQFVLRRLLRRLLEQLVLRRRLLGRPWSPLAPLEWWLLRRLLE
jgi:hypothetical protein